MIGALPQDIAQTLAACGLQTFSKQAADGAAATATAETVIGIQGAGKGFGVKSVMFAPAAALTGDPTNNATINVYKRASTAPGTQVLLATLTTTASWTAWLAVALTVQAGATINPGDVITFVITKGGTGVVVPQGQLEIFTGVQ